jgi:hypothetical protein
MEYPIYEPRLNTDLKKWYIVEHSLVYKRTWYGVVKPQVIEQIWTVFEFGFGKEGWLETMFFDTYADVRAYIKSIGKEILELPEKSSI